MSTILKALRRLEEEKNAGAERTLDEQIVASRPPEPSSRRLRVLLIGAAVIAGIGAGSSVLYLWSDRESAPASEPPTPAASARVEPERAAASEAPDTKPAEPARRDPIPLREPHAVASTIEVVKRVEDEPPDAVEPPPELPADTAPSRARAAAEPESEVAVVAVTELAERSAPIEPRAVVEPRVAPPSPALAEAPVEPPAPEADSPVVKPRVPPAPTLVEPPAPEADSSGVAEPPAPPPSQRPKSVAPSPPVEVAAAEMADDAEPLASAPKPGSSRAETGATPADAPKADQKIIMRAKLPTVRVDSTTWHPDARRRMAVVSVADSNEVLHLREGDAVGPLVVEVIEPGGVFFAHDGIAVRYNVGE